MDSGRRGVESYWRSRMIDAATSDEDEVTPVYKLEEIRELLRSSHVSIVKEVSEFILKRLDHNNPIVKQKAQTLPAISNDDQGAAGNDHSLRVEESLGRTSLSVSTPICPVNRSTDTENWSKIGKSSWWYLIPAHRRADNGSVVGGRTRALSSPADEILRKELWVGQRRSEVWVGFVRKG